MKLIESTLVKTFAASAVWAALLGSILMLSGCGTISTDITTTTGSESASLTAAGNTAAGASVASSNTATGTTVTSISGSNITLSAGAIATGTVPVTITNSVAVQLQDDITSYTETVSNALQTIGPQILSAAGNAATITADVGTLLQQYGLAPVNATQRTTVSNIISIATKVATGAASLNSLLTGISTTGAVPTTTPSTTLLERESREYASLWRLP